MMTIYDIITEYKGARCIPELKNRKLLPQLKDLTKFLPGDCMVGRRIWHVRNDKLFIIKCFNSECNNDAKYVDNKCKYVCCSQTCKMAYIQQQNILKWGVSMPCQVKEFANKIGTSLKDRTSEEIKKSVDKRIQTNRLKHGVDHTAQADSIKSKIFATNYGKYGTKIPSQNEIIKEKIIKKMSEIDFSEIIARRRQTCISKYGVDDVMKSHEIKNIVVSTMNTKEFKEILLGKRIDVLYERMKNDDYEIINYNMGATAKTAHLIKHTLLHKLCGNKFEMPVTKIYRRLYDKVELCPYCNETKYNISVDEIKLRKMIASVYGGEMLCNYKQLINPYEVDVYLPEKQIAFEYNGLYWHNDLIKDKDYHMMKTNMCMQNGVRLIHIFEHEWMTKRNIIESIIFGLFGKHNVIYARNCIIKNVTSSEYSSFCEANHLMGYGSASVIYGLYNNSELVEIMSFVAGKDDVWTISRLCSILYTTITGGANKLFKHFLKNHKYSKIISYSDRSMFSGDVYKHMGMFMEKTTEPGYSMINTKTFESINRRTYLTSSAEKRTKIDSDCLKVYNSGNQRFVYTNQNINDEEL